MHTAQINPATDLSQSVFGFAAPEPFKPLTQFQQRVLGWVRSRASLPQGFCKATKTMAARFGCSVRYVQMAIRSLIDRGLIVREWDFGLKTRRRLRLPVSHEAQTELALTQDVAAEAQNQGPDFVELTNSGSLADALPPIKSSGENERGDNGPPASSSSLQLEEGLISKAAEVLGLPTPAARKIVSEATAKAERPEHVESALDIVARAGAKARDRVAYLFGTIANIVLQGGPRTPAPAPPPPVIHYHVAAPPPPIDPLLVGVKTWREMAARLDQINGSKETNS